MTKIINIFAGPGAGKSTFAASLFSEMKRRGISVEMPYEFPKNLAWEGNSSALSDQLWIFAHQHRSITQLYGKVDYIIMDSPLMLSVLYKHWYSIEYPATLYDYTFDELVYNIHSSYISTNIFLERNPDWHTNAGRMQNLEESIKIDNELQGLCHYYGIDTIKINPANVSIEKFIDVNIL